METSQDGRQNEQGGATPDLSTDQDRYIYMYVLGIAERTNIVGRCPIQGLWELRQLKSRQNVALTFGVEKQVPRLIQVNIEV